MAEAEPQGGRIVQSTRNVSMFADLLVVGSSCTNRADIVFLRSVVVLPRTQLDCCLPARAACSPAGPFTSPLGLPDGVECHRRRSTWLRSAGVSRGKVESCLSHVLLHMHHGVTVQDFGTTL